MAIDSLVAVGIFVFVVISFIFSAVKTVSQGSNWTVERFGRYTHTLRP
ncbi:SPFH/Band 7/PHB domain protein, partial [Vibrio sp. V25_P4S6T154]|nr:SPFH/Band 7/PHB domain protein [Vibrio sp. V25_P4S6T154]